MSHCQHKERGEELIATEYQLKSEFEDLTKPGQATRFCRMISPFYHSERWAVRWLSYCLNQKGKWEHEPMPSSRNDKFYKRCRFYTLEEAIQAWNRREHDQT